MTQTNDVLGIDFGTSNSAAGILRNGKPWLVTLEDTHVTQPTTFFFDFDTRQTLIGHAANQALLDGADGRFMRALKRILGTSLMHEERQLLGRRQSFVDIIAGFLAQIKQKAEAQTGHSFPHALSGRPVFFHAPSDPREPQAEADLRACYHAAGFASVSFLPEPQAAALASPSHQTKGDIGLIVDIGGGTSDFSLFETTQTGIAILANHGVRIGGTDFDRAISVDHVMPSFGLGSQLRKVFGAGTTPVPKALFHQLATWEEIPFLYTKQNQSAVAEMTRLAQEPEKLSRLKTVLTHHLGHDLAFAVEDGKIAANAGTDGANISLSDIEKGLTLPLTTGALDQSLARFSLTLKATLAHLLDQSDLTQDRISHVIYVGGSSLMNMVQNTLKSELPTATHNLHNVHRAVADGLAIAAAQSRPS